MLVVLTNTLGNCNPTHEEDQNERQWYLGAPFQLRSVRECPFNKPVFPTPMEEMMYEQYSSDPPELENLPDAGSLAYQLPETVCGSDERTQITATANIPWRWICELIIRYPDGAGARGTGWFIGPHTVMTAGHVVFSKANGGWARQIEVIPGMNGTLRPFGSQIGTSFRSVTGWTQNTNPEYEYGAIILPNNNLGARVGWFGFAVLRAPPEIIESTCDRVRYRFTT